MNKNIFLIVAIALLSNLGFATSAKHYDLIAPTGRVMDIARNIFEKHTYTGTYDQVLFQVKRADGDWDGIISPSEQVQLAWIMSDYPGLFGVSGQESVISKEAGITTQESVNSKDEWRSVGYLFSIVGPYTLIIIILIGSVRLLIVLDRKNQERLSEKILRLEKERLEKERLEKERLEKERLEKERLEKERLEKERLEKERLEKERLEKERLEKERLEKERLEKERLEKERLEKERLEKERLEKERLEKERLEKLIIGLYHSLPFYTINDSQKYSQYNGDNFRWSNALLAIKNNDTTEISLYLVKVKDLDTGDLYYKIGTAAQEVSSIFLKRPDLELLELLYVFKMEARFALFAGFHFIREFRYTNNPKEIAKTSLLFDDTFEKSKKMFSGYSEVVKNNSIKKILSLMRNLPGYVLKAEDLFNKKIKQE